MDMDRTETYQVTHTTMEGEAFVQVWVGPPNSEQALPCVRVPDQACMNETLREKINELAIAIYQDYLATCETEPPRSVVVVDDGVDREPS